MKRKVEASPESAHSHLPSAAGHEDSTPLVLTSLGWESLPNGQSQLLLECSTLVDYVTMPKELLFGPFTVVKAGWDEDRKAALYREDSAADGAPNLIVE